MIHKFVMRNFKRFTQETAVDLEPVTILIGANNSGKSTLLQAMNLFQYCVETTRSGANGNAKSGGKNGLELVKRTVSPDEFGALPVADPTDLWPQGKAKNPIHLKAEYSSGLSVEFELSISYNRFSIRPRVEGTLGEDLGKGNIRLVPIFTGFLPQEEYLTPPARLDRMRLQRHGEMVRNLLWELQDKAKERWRLLIRFLERLFPDSSVTVNFDVEVDRFIRATYHDDILTRDRDIVSAGSGFHQALQILAAVLSPGAHIALLDEPDAHLHARLQSAMTQILVELTEKEDLQFVIATHSPHVLSAAPPGALRVCVGGKFVPFAHEPGQLRILEDVGAMDRMDIIPLLSNRAVVFVENKGDRDLLERFAAKHWGEVKARAALSKVSFLYTYQEPVSARVLNLARQVNDLLGLPKMPGAKPARFLAIGDRDYRSDEALKADVQEHKKKAKSPAYRFDFQLLIWKRNELENYLIEKAAILKALDTAVGKDQVSAWKGKRAGFAEEFDRLIASQREQVRQHVASRLQNQDRRLELRTALERADSLLNTRWDGGIPWCDAKAILSSLRNWLQKENLRLRLSEAAIIEAMDSIPEDVKKALLSIRGMSKLPRARAKKPGASGLS
ncbi:MAG: AAA family ATPase [Candidatus Omnitrophica bacterium]|nr:AAA family ATPase [Candidatus Omnitrophota bacterium]